MMNLPLTSIDAAPQHGPRPLPLFVDLLRAQTEGAPARRRAALVGLARYQAAAREPPRTLAPMVRRNGRVVLRDYGGAGVPVVFVPSLINPAHILDLDDDRSLLRWLRARGHRVLMIDWGSPAPEDVGEDIGAHVAARLVPLIETLEAPALLVGYCLGGTMAAAAACLMPVAGLAMIAAPWQFAGFGAAARARIADLWRHAEPMCRPLGLVPIEVLQAGFWSLDPARTIAKYERYATLAPDSPESRAFVAVEDWANAGAPLTYAAGAQMFDFFARDLPGTGAWKIEGTAIDPRALNIPTIDFVSTSDRIVPAASAIGFAEAHRLAAGHVGMIVGSGARAQLWEPLDRWISGVTAAT